jgi:tetratricopeptide (TPR) repeat protein
MARAGFKGGSSTVVFFILDKLSRRRDLCTFARQLMLADPQHSIPVSNLIQQYSVELEYLVDLIKWRLDMRKQEPNEWNADNPFYWRFALQGTGVPSEIEERVEGFYERGEYDRAEVLFRLLADCFEDYAEGYNYLGLMSLDREKLDEAIDHFQKAMDLGRKKFPKRMPRSRYWNDISTRPYIRAMRNLTLALNRVGRYEEALRLCERLDQECGDNISPLAYRASIYLNTGCWQEAADSALRLHK